MSKVRPVKGELVAIVKNDKRQPKGAWEYYIMQVEEEEYEVSINTESYSEPSKGDNILLWPAKYGHNYGGVVDPEQEKKYAAKSKSGSKGGRTYSDDYWKDKFNYEVNVKDSSLRFQGVYSKIMDLYASNFSGAGATSEVLNKAVDVAVSKANEICSTYNPDNGRFEVEGMLEEKPKSSKTVKKASKTADVEF